MTLFPIPVQTRLLVRLNNLTSFMLCGKTIGKTHKRGNLAERGGFEPPVEVLAPTTV